MLRTADQENERVRARIDRLVNRLPCMVYRCRIDLGEQMDSDYRMTLEYVSRGSQDLLGISEKNMVENAWNTLERMARGNGFGIREKPFTMKTEPLLISRACSWM